MARKEKNAKSFDSPNPLKEKHYKYLHKKIVLRLSVTYLAPLIFLIAFFLYQYTKLNTEGVEQYLMLVAKSQARTLDFFLTERVGNVLNVIDDPAMGQREDPAAASVALQHLRRHSDAFIDIGIIDAKGIQVQYAGPLTSLERRDYSGEDWYRRLLSLDSRFIITDCYLGLRNAPHFTIGAKFPAKGEFYVLRASLDPGKMFNYITSLEKSSDVYISIVSRSGYYQLIHSNLGRPLDKSPIIPDPERHLGVSRAPIGNREIGYAFAWLAGVDWAVITRHRETGLGMGISGGKQYAYTNLLIASLAVILIMTLIIAFRSKEMVQTQHERDVVKTQLQQAAKLATVGELAAGIAHEIGNPLNIIANEVGIMEDFCEPKFNAGKTIYDLQPHFDKITKSVYRIKDITSKMLTFVRQDDIILKSYDINALIEEFIVGFYEKELELKNIELIKRFSPDLTPVLLDGNQFRQVLANLLNNAADAITPPGVITLSTFMDGNNVGISVSDTGCGIKQEEIDKIFTPFYTTKPVGKGTGLGLSVSYGIIENLGGDIKVESIPGKGTVFTVYLYPLSK